MAIRNIGRDRSHLVRQIVESRGLTLFQISRESRARYGDSRYFIPHQLYAHLRDTEFTPKIQQILALSSITNYRPVDWFSVFGFRLDAIAPLQATLPAKRTQLIDSTVHDDQEWIPWFTEVSSTASATGIVPLGQLLSAGTFRRASTFPFLESSPFLYAKVGYEDVFAYPDLLPGSIVRFDTRKKHGSSDPKSIAKPFVLIEHSKGLSISRLHSEQVGHITLRPGKLPFPQVELRLDREARVLGVADLDLRLLVGGHHPGVSDVSLPHIDPLPEELVPLTFGRLLVRSRQRSGLSFREASRLSLKIAAELKDDHYFCAPGALSDYEVRGDPPRHVHKLISLAILYALKWTDLINAAALELGEIGREPIPEPLLSRGHSELDSATPVQQPGFIHGLVQTFEEIPLFLTEAFPTLVGLPALSLRDIYWMGGQTASRHPRLMSTVLAIIDRRRKRPVDAPRSALTEQPLFLLLVREKGYVAAECHQKGELLVAHPFSDRFRDPLHLRIGIDAEVIGRIVAILRWLA
ncbi:MAG: hypothetical protein JO260_07155 [Acidobacteria bacterium]|nr:hypothetical protein [Acidobacteriota bacterium]